MTLNRAVLARWNRMLSKQATGCWLATTTNTADGYARWRPSPGEREVYVHVWAYSTCIGPIPTGMQVDHRCHTDDTDCPGGDACMHRRCCNPEHLELVTNSENTMRQRHANRGKTHCPKGHEYTPENTVVWNDNKRRCATCLGRRGKDVSNLPHSGSDTAADRTRDTL